MQHTSLPSATVIDQLSSRPNGWRRVEWATGAFETASRPITRAVEGRICSGNHLIMATLSGGAERHEIVTDCGHRYEGPDHAASISFLPARCGRRVKLRNVAWRWAAIGLNPGLIAEAASVQLDVLRPFTGFEDTFILSMLREFDRLDALDGGLDPVYCDTMSLALALYLARRHDGRIAASRFVSSAKLPTWRLRRITEFVDANIDQPIRVADLAALADLSEGYFHRAFRATTGKSPLNFIQARRVEFAKQLLVGSRGSITELALETGFVSPAHFARIFRAFTGMSPSDYRRAFCADT